MRYTDPATGDLLDDDLPTPPRRRRPPPPAKRTAPGQARQWRTVVSLEHGSFLTCRERLGCTNVEHLELRLDYWRNVHTRYRRRLGVRPYEEVHPRSDHGTGPAAYRRCTDGPDGRPCQACRDSEAARQRRIRADREARQ